MKSARFPRLLITLALMAMLAFGCIGCLGDDDDDTTGPGTPDEFDQPTAIAQSQLAGPQAVTMVENMSTIAGGVGTFRDDYSWNAAEQRWEYNYVWSDSGYDYDWLFTVQYLASGTPQQDEDGADAINHTMHGTMDYEDSQQGADIVLHYIYDYDVTITGMSTRSVLTLEGGGYFDIDYTYSFGGINQSYNYVANWETVGPNHIQAEENGGCPTGTIRYSMDPYYLDVVFDGSSSATATLYDGNDAVVPGGGGTYSLNCNTN